jgi:hypothetical protein
MKKHTLILALCVALTASCVNHHGWGHPHGMPPGQAKKVAHAHGSSCGHVHVDGAWISISKSRRHKK